MRYGMVIDTSRCVACHACEVACKSANNVPVGVFWNRVLTDGGSGVETLAGEYPNGTISVMTISCQHCENPACVKVCPVGATYKDPETGVVRQDYDKCIGCRMCMAACPYTGVRSFNWDEPKYALDFATGDAEVPLHQKHTVEKCTFCYQRVTQGQTPACMCFVLAAPVIGAILMTPNRRCRSSSRRGSTSSCFPKRGRSPRCTTWYSAKLSTCS